MSWRTPPISNKCLLCAANLCQKPTASFGLTNPVLDKARSV
jgi:hypothetical protein